MNKLFAKICKSSRCLLLLLSLVCLNACYHYSDEEQDIGKSDYRKTYSAYLDSVSVEDEDAEYHVSWDSNYDNGEVKFWISKGGRHVNLELVGCESYLCLETKKIMVYSDNYRYTRIFKSDEFKITEPEEKFFEGHGDCEIRKDLYFNIVIDQDDFKIDWTVKYGAVTCERLHYDGVPSDWSVWG